MSTRRSQPVTDRNPPIWLGLDVGGTWTRSALLGPGGRLLGFRRFDTPRGLSAGEAPAFLAARARESLGPLAPRARGVGVAVAGQVDRERGVVRSAPNLGWRSLPLGRTLERDLGLPVLLENDGRAAAAAEGRRGAGRGEGDFLLVLVGTGVGGGIVSGGRLLRGSSGSAGEIGHSLLVEGGARCPCGGRGCLEAYVGGRSLAARGITPAAGRRLGAGIASLVNILNPRLVILGGGLLDGVPRIRTEAVAAARRAVLPAAARGLRFARPALGERAGAVGAAELSRDLARGRP